MTSEERADEIIARWGMPKSPEAWREILAYAHMQGKVDGAHEVRQAMKDGFQQKAVSV